MSVAYLSTAYLAPVPYCRTLVSFDEIRIETAENYPRQTLRNRCLIAAANGIQTLTVPVEKPATPKCPTRDIRISGHGNWRHLHWNALVSAYNMSPFFEYYADDFRPFYEKAYTYLLDYNDALQHMICGLLDIHPLITHTAEYAPQTANDFRTTLLSHQPPPRPYYQVFRDKHGFIPNLSIADLLFNMGPEATLYVAPDILHLPAGL
jgi:hypothetical protein